MLKTESLSRNSSRKLSSPQNSLRRLGLCPQISTSAGQQTSPVVFPEKRGKVKASRTSDVGGNQQQDKGNRKEEHRIDIGGDENANLLGSVVYSAKLSLTKKKIKSTTEVNQSSSKETKHEPGVDAKLTTVALFWGTHRLALDDVVSVTYNVGVRHFTVHAYPLIKASCGLSCFMKARRTHKDFCFLASNSEEALQWVLGFADQQCFINCLPHPLASAKKQTSSELIIVDTPIELHLKCKSPPKVLVILNPRSGRGRSTKVFHNLVEPVFKLAGFRMEVVNTTSAGHAKNLAATVDFSTCPDGIICVGGDGIVNEVLNGLLSRGNQKEAISIPIGIIPAGSDNSLVWTVLGVRDPISAAIAIVKGGLTATDVLAVEWIQTGAIHYGMTVAYYGFVSDVLELSEKYQKRFGPLRYLVAGVLKFLCLPKYSFEVEYLPAEKLSSAEHDVVDMQDLYTDIMRRSSKESLPRASSLSSIDSIMTPSRMSFGDMDNSHANSEPSEVVRGIDPKSKRMSFGRSNDVAEPEVIHPQIPHATTPSWPRTRSKSKTDKGWAGMTTNDSSNRCSWANSVSHDKEDISSTLSDPGPIWDSEPNWDVENPIELPGPPEAETDNDKDVVIRHENKWVSKKGLFLGVLVCNHSCKTVQGFSSQVVAPAAVHDDNTLDLLLVHGSGRFRLLRFFLLLQLGKHLSLPYVEYVKVKSVKLKNGKNTTSGCGIDGELLPVSGQVISSLLPEQCRLIGRSPL